MASEVTDEAIQGLIELYEHQEDSPLPKMRFHTWPWVIVKSILAVLILTTIYLLYSLLELPFTLFGSIFGLAVFAGGPFFTGYVYGLSFQHIRRTMALSIFIGMLAIALMLYLFYTPYRMDIFLDFGVNYSRQMWWYVLLSFFNMISFFPIGAAVACSTNQYE